MFVCFTLMFLILGLTGTANSASPVKSPLKITVALPAEPDTLDPTTTRFSVTSAPISNNIFERLVDLTPDGKFVPGIASWKVSPDGKVVEFTLRKGVKFHSGDPLTTKDVEFSHNRALKNNPTHQRAMRNLDRFEIVDDYTCRFIFKKPDVLFIPTRSLTIVSNSYYNKVGEDQFVRNPVGTGPYKFVEWKLGEYIDITANDNYWGAKAPGQTGAIQVRERGLHKGSHAEVRRGRHHHVHAICHGEGCRIRRVQDSPVTNPPAYLYPVSYPQP